MRYLYLFLMLFLVSCEHAPIDEPWSPFTSGSAWTNPHTTAPRAGVKAAVLEMGGAFKRDSAAALLASSICEEQLLPDAVVGVKMNAFVFFTAMVAYLTGDATAVQVRDFLNGHLAENGNPAMSAQNETDLVAFKTTYDGLAAADQAKYLSKLEGYAQMAQDERITCTTFDNFLD